MADNPPQEPNQGTSTARKTSDARIARVLPGEPVRSHCENVWTGGSQGRPCEDLHAIREYLDSVAPPHLAEKWDRVGLLSAPPFAPTVANILVALDLTPPVCDETIHKGIDLLVCYHPPIFKPLDHLCAQGDGPAALAVKLAYYGVAIYSPHTALDVAEGGTNDALAAALSLRTCGSLVLPVPRRRYVKLVVFVPESHVEEMAGAVFAAGGGRIGKNTSYSQCSFRTKGTGTFFGDESTSPAVGEKGRLEFVPEVRFETVVPISCLDAVVKALRDSHPYEEPAFDLLTTESLPEEPGMGRLASLEKPLPLAALAQHAKKSLGLDHVQLVGAPDREVSTLAVLAGSCGRLPIEAGGNRMFDAVITGELKHHDMIALRAAGISAICLGHGRSEKPALRMLRDKLAGRFPSLEVQLSSADVAPYQWV